MRFEDNELARKLLLIRKKINLVKAQKSCDEHASMIDDVEWEIEEEGELTGLYKGEIRYNMCAMTSDVTALINY